MAAHEVAGSGAHEPVMLREVVEALEEIPTGIFLDATVGAGGHASALLERRPDLTCVGLDRDPEALAMAARRLPDGVRLAQRRFDALGEALAGWDVGCLAGALFDLGASSMQLDDPGRGFSYRRGGPIDMRMDPTSGPCAAGIVNEWPAERLAGLLRGYGDEPNARRIARAVAANRPLRDTAELAEVVCSAVPPRRRRRGGHPAKRTFQALRIAVNDELAQIRPALSEVIGLLAPKGRGVVLSYHSGEDRIVKETLGEAAGGCTCPPRLPCVCGAVKCIALLGRRARRPAAAEVQANPRSRSARLRAFEKLEATQS
ncbi:MAG: 16S rRNA (cytosine(1402)-N(4))-methyltransferase RsmH [bacterium]|nr:16S rRNA (cytosine(1402)-N(4))-methyltransferase RsmH [bacterium]